jgi:hypothetical protein
MNRRITADKYTRYETPRPYVQLSLELLGSVSMAALSLAASRVLFRLITEHLTNAGKENGKLAVSYRQLATYAGVHEKQIASALAELVDLGLVVVVQGRRPKGATKTPPNFYRLTFLPDHEGGWPSDEWRRFESSDPKAWAVALARAKDIARAARKRRMGGKPFRSEEEADAANAPAKRRLKRIGKERINGPGNKQTRAALNEANGRNDSSKIHFAQRDESSRGSERIQGTSHPVEAAKARTDRPVGGHGTTRPVPSTTSVLIRSDAAEGATLSSVLARLGPVGEVNGELLSLREAARIKGVSIPTLRNAIDDGRLPAMRCVDHRGAGYSIDPIDLVNYQPLKLRKARSTRDRLCEACGAPFVSKRDDAIYCSTSCQKNGPRRRRRAAARAARAARLADLELRRRTQ